LQKLKLISLIADSAIAAAADAAAVAAATMSEKKGSSEQPVACPLCNFVIKQSRNLRRHLEIKHFGGLKYKKGKHKVDQHSIDCSDTDNDSSADPIAADHVQVEIRNAPADDSMTNTKTETKEPLPLQYNESPLQQYAHVPPAILSHQIVVPPSGYVPQHIQILKSPHGGPHPIFTATVTQPGSQILGLYGVDGSSPPPHQ